MGCPLEAVVRDGNVVLTRAKEIEGAPIDQPRLVCPPTLLTGILWPHSEIARGPRGESLSCSVKLNIVCTRSGLHNRLEMVQTGVTLTYAYRDLRFPPLAL